MTYIANSWVHYIHILNLLKIVSWLIPIVVKMKDRCFQTQTYKITIFFLYRYLLFKSNTHNKNRDLLK